MAADPNKSLIFSKKIEKELNPNQTAQQTSDFQFETKSTLDNLLSKKPDPFKVAIKKIEQCKNFQDSTDEALITGGAGSSAIKRLWIDQNNAHMFEYRVYTKVYEENDEYGHYSIKKYRFQLSPKPSDPGFEFSFFEVKDQDELEINIPIDYLEPSIIAGNEMRLMVKDSAASKDPALYPKFA